MAITIPQLNSFCCCSLKTATIAAGLFQLIFLLLYIVDITVHTIIYLRNHGRIRYDEIFAQILFEQSVFIQTLLSLLLIYGAIREKSSFLMAWLLFGVAFTIESLWGLILNLNRYIIWEFILEDIFIIVLQLIAMLVAYNYYRTMSKDDYRLYI